MKSHQITSSCSTDGESSAAKLDASEGAGRAKSVSASLIIDDVAMASVDSPGDAFAAVSVRRDGRRKW